MGKKLPHCRMLYMYMYVYMCVCVCIYIYIYIYIYLFIHTHTQSRARDLRRTLVLMKNRGFWCLKAAPSPESGVYHKINGLGRSLYSRPHARHRCVGSVLSAESFCRRSVPTAHGRLKCSAAFKSRAQDIFVGLQ